MPCLRIGKRGFVCLSNEPVAVKHNGRTYLFEWTAASGWIRVDRDGSQSPVPKAVEDKLAKLPRGD